MNHKGFSLIEILATISIIGILTGVAIVGYTRYVDSSRKKAYEIMVESARVAMENYTMDNPTVTEATFEELVDAGYLSNPVDPGNKDSYCKGKVVLNENTDPTLNKPANALDKNDYKVSICCNRYLYTYEINGIDRHRDRFCKAEQYDVEDIETIKVLGVYPKASFSTQLSSWMNTVDSATGQKIGKGIIDVQMVLIDNFNANPSSYLGTPGNWKVDVVVFGFSDCYSAKDLNDTSTAALEQYILDDQSVIFGHDTLIDTKSSSCGNHSHFNSLAKYVNIELYDADKGHTNHNKVKIVREGIFTTYPWRIGDLGTVLTIPTSHVSAQIAHGDVWMVFDGMADDPTRSIYLSTYGNNAFIQTGHTGGSATLDEKKIIANIIFYMFAKQYTD